MTYVFDIDGTICSLTDGDYKEAKPFEDRIKIINYFMDCCDCVINQIKMSKMLKKTTSPLT